MIVIIRQDKYMRDRLIKYDPFQNNVGRVINSSILLEDNGEIKQQISQQQQSIQKYNQKYKLNEINKNTNKNQTKQNTYASSGFQFTSQQHSIQQQLQKQHSKQNKYQLQQTNCNKQLNKIVKQQYDTPKQRIKLKSKLNPEVFNWIEVQNMRKYISQLTDIYHQIVPFKIKYIVSPTTQISKQQQNAAKIKINNYFQQNCTPTIYYLKPNSNILCHYDIKQVSKLHTISKQYISQQKLPISWKFTQYTQSTITPNGRIFAINCQTTANKLDPYLIQIAYGKDSKKYNIINRGKIPNPKANSAFICCNNSLYIIGGNNKQQKCSNKCYKYILNTNKWVQLADCKQALKNPTVCLFRNKYILKIGGINQFDYICKNVQIYDTASDKWSHVRVQMKSSSLFSNNYNVQFLQKSLAVQINYDQIYVFGGKNANNYSTDTGFIMEMKQIKMENDKFITAVNSQLWSANFGHRNLLSFWGMYSPNNVIIYNKCLYIMRVSETQMIKM